MPSLGPYNLALPSCLLDRRDTGIDSPSIKSLVGHFGRLDVPQERVVSGVRWLVRSLQAASPWSTLPGPGQ